MKHPWRCYHIRHGSTVRGVRMGDCFFSDN